MNAKQREYISKTLADLGKGLLLAVAVGGATGKMSPEFVWFYLALSAYAFLARYRLEGDHRDTS